MVNGNMYEKRDVASNGKAGEKRDSGKARWDLVDYDAVGDMVDVLTYGAEKYEEDNWKKVENGTNRYFAALMRHLTAWRSGEKMDKESGLKHLAHAMANLMFLMFLDRE